jgi:hypothetical protein
MIQGSEGGDVVAHGGGSGGGEGSEQEDRSDRGGVRRTEGETHRELEKNSKKTRTLKEDMSIISDGWG